MAGWGKLVAGTLIGVAGTVYATNEEFRKKLPGAARDLPDKVRQRLKTAVSAGREASSERRAEILRDLGQHGGQHGERDPNHGEETEPLPGEKAENMSGATPQPDERDKQGE